MTPAPVQLAAIAFTVVSALIGAGMLCASIARDLRQGGGLAAKIGGLVVLGISASVALSVAAAKGVR